MQTLFRVYSLIMVVWCFTYVLGCDDDTSAEQSTEPNAGVVAGGMSMITAGEIAGENAGTSVGEIAGISAGISAGENAGVSAGEMAGVSAGIPAGTESPLVVDELPHTGEYITGNTMFDSSLDASTVRVGWIENEADALQGINTHCRVGCLRIENDLVRFCIQGQSNFSQFAYTGGNIIDAQHVNSLGIDHLSEIIVAPGLGEVIVEEIGIIQDGSESENAPAIIQVKGRSNGSRLLAAYIPTLVPDPMQVVTEYRLYPHRTDIEVYSWFSAEGRPLNFKMYDLVIWSDQARSYYPLQNSNLVPTQTDYFAAHAPQVSYVWRSLDQAQLNFFNLPVLPVVPISLGQIFGVDGSTVLFRRSLDVGQGSIAHHKTAEDPAVIPLKIQATLSEISPDIRADNNHPLFPAKLFVDRSFEIYTEQDEAPFALITQVRLDAMGQAEVQLPPGNYYVISDTWHSMSFTQRITHSVEQESHTIELPTPSVVRIQVQDQNQQNIATKVRARSSQWGEKIILAMTTKDVVLPAGEWRIDITRGWHYTASSETPILIAGTLHEHTITLTEVIPFEGWTSGEFHQHSAPSLDSNVTRNDRVYSNLAEGVGFMVPSDHDVLTDYPSLVNALGFQDRIAAPITGLEISPVTGHLGAYGITYQADHEQAAGGAPPIAETFEINGELRWRRRVTPALVQDARSRGAEIIQINHPRDSTGYFDTVGYQPDQPIDLITHEDWTTDFDTIEVYNGSSDFCKMMRDWHGLLAQGKRVTAIGNSDSHGLIGKPVGYPRNYLPTAGENQQSVTKEEIVNALRIGQVSVGGGAFMDLPDGPMWSDQLSGNTHAIRLRVRTAPFNKITRIVALHKGREIWSQELNVIESEIIDFDEVVNISIDSDGPLVFFAEGPSLAYVYEGAPTFALSNPLWIDADNDGSIQQDPITAPPSFTTSFCSALAP
jgi:hypothetical protein